MKMRAIISLIPSVLLFVLLMGSCYGYGFIPSKREVENEVAQTVENEEYELDRVEKIRTRPRKKVYHYKSKERDMEFTATSALIPQYTFFFQFKYYERYVYTDYVQSVRSFYYDDTLDILTSSPYFDDSMSITDRYLSANKYYLKIKNYAELQDAAQTVYEVSQLYSNEQQYNSESWVTKNPLIELSVIWDSQNEEKTYRDIILYSFHITGMEEEDSILHELEIKYAEWIKEGRIPEDEMVPDSIMKQVYEED